MSLIMKQAITGPEAWKGADMVGDTSWIYPLSPEVLATLDAALAQVKAKGLTFPHFDRRDFPIGDWAQTLRAYSDELENGRGFLVLRGLPTTTPCCTRAMSSKTMACTNSTARCCACGSRCPTPAHWRQSFRGAMVFRRHSL